MNDQVLYLKHNLNARAVQGLRDEVIKIDYDVTRLLAAMRHGSLDGGKRLRPMLLLLAAAALGKRGDGNAGVGADAYMIAHTPTPWKRLLGVVAYALTASQGLLLKRRPFAVRATV